MTTPQRLNGMKYRRLSDIEAKPIRWLWPGKIACGKLSLIGGNPGLGKTQLCCSLAAIITKAGQWPVDRTQHLEPGNVIILSAEDDAEDTIRPRLEAAGADLDRVFLLDAVEVEDEHGESGERTFNIASDVLRLEHMIADIGGCDAVFIDPISAYLGSTDSHKNAEVRALLSPLQAAAARTGAAVIGLTHLTKAQGIDALARLMGSVAFGAAARAVWGVTKDKDDPALRLFLPLKNNLGTDTGGYAYRVESFVLEGSDPPIGTSRIMWEDRRIDISADEAFASVARDFNEQSEIELAKDFLQDLLAGGMVESEEVQRAAKRAGHAWSTVRRAQGNMKIIPARNGFGKDGKWFWQLPGEQQA